ncbi:cupin domain-containing protein [Streptomyces sp. NPDC096339]|uniref:cupin domain-containing protein n=1 Tax=Streptomyces sp. NPDC096339 TaxID=3366086 RepID=UPI0038266D28
MRALQVRAAPPRATTPRPRPKPQSKSLPKSLAKANPKPKANPRSKARAKQAVPGREVVIPPGGCTGWHFHRVPLDAVVLAGTLTRVLSDGTVETHPAGTSFVEPAGIDHIHLGHNLGAEPVVLHITPALPAGTPFAIPTPPPPGVTGSACCR